MNESTESATGAHANESIELPAVFSESEPQDTAELPHSYARIAAVLGVTGMIGGLFVMWMVPFSVAALLFAEFARRQGHTHWPTKLAFSTGAVGVLFGGVWMIYSLGLLAG